MANYCFNKLELEYVGDDDSNIDVEIFHDIFTGKKIKDKKIGCDDNSSITPNTVEGEYNFANFLPVSYYELYMSNGNYFGEKLVAKYGTDIRIDSYYVDYSIDNEGDRSEYIFHTRWSAPIRAIVEISVLFPDIIFKLTFDEPGCRYAGEIEIRNKTIINEFITDNDEIEYRKFIVDILNEEYMFTCESCGYIYFHDDELFDYCEKDNDCDYISIFMSMNCSPKTSNMDILIMNLLFDEHNFICHNCNGNLNDRLRNYLFINNNYNTNGGN